MALEPPLPGGVKPIESCLNTPWTKPCNDRALRCMWRVFRQDFRVSWMAQVRYRFGPQTNGRAGWIRSHCKLKTRQNSYHFAWYTSINKTAYLLGAVVGFSLSCGPGLPMTIPWQLCVREPGEILGRHQNCPSAGQQCANFAFATPLTFLAILGGRYFLGSRASTALCT